MTADGNKPNNDTPRTPPRLPVSAEPKNNAPDPTRYGDWEIRGKCVDF